MSGRWRRQRRILELPADCTLRAPTARASTTPMRALTLANALSAFTATLLRRGAAATGRAARSASRGGQPTGVRALQGAGAARAAVAVSMVSGG